MLYNDKKTSWDKQSAPESRLNSTPSQGRAPAALAIKPWVSLPVTGWHPLFDTVIQKEASGALEAGKILLLPHLSFTLTREEETFLRSDCVAQGSRAIEFSSKKRHLEGVAQKETETLALEALLKRYAEAARDLMVRLFPGYAPELAMESTVFRPIDARRGGQGLRRDDRLLHVDAVSARPSKGLRRLCIVTNIHPAGLSYNWRIGEPFSELMARFLPRLNSPMPGSAFLLRLLQFTRRLRTPYDHYMLELHDKMKRDTRYQAEGPQTTISLPAGSSWILFSDQVPHAVMSGQYALEQTFMIPPELLDDPDTSPLHVMEKMMARKLI